MLGLYFEWTRQVMMFSLCSILRACNHFQGTRVRTRSTALKLNIQVQTLSFWQSHSETEISNIFVEILPVTVMLVTSLCWRSFSDVREETNYVYDIILLVGDFPIGHHLTHQQYARILVPSSWYWWLVTNITYLSLKYLLSNIRDQHRCNRFFLKHVDQINFQIMITDLIKL